MTFINASTHASTSNNTAVTVTTPAGVQVGDTLLAVVAQGWSNNQTLSGTGWTQHGDQVVVEASGYGFVGAIFTKTHDGSAITFASTANERFAIIVAGFTNIAGVDAVSAWSIGKDGTVTCPDVTTTVADAIVLRVALTDEGTLPHTSPSEIIAEVDASSGAAASLHQRTQEAPGSTGTVDISLLGGGDDWSGLTIALAPESMGPEDLTDPTIAIDLVHGSGHVDDIYRSVGFDPNTNVLTVTGTAADAGEVSSGIRLVEIIVDDEDPVAADDTSGGAWATWAADINVHSWTAGTHTIQAIAHDNAGNSSPVASRTVWHCPDGVYVAAATAGDHLVPAGFSGSPNTI